MAPTGSVKRTSHAYSSLLVPSEKGGWKNYAEPAMWQLTPWWVFWRPKWYRRWQFWSGDVEVEYVTDEQLARLTLENAFGQKT